MKPNLRFWTLISISLHVVGFIFLTAQFNLFKKEPPQVLRVQLVSLPKGDAKPIQPKPAEKIKTQASIAPKEPPKNIDKPKPAAEAPKVKIKKTVEKKETPKKEKPKPKKPKETVKEAQKEAKPRPPKLDKTPDKEKAIRSKDADAKTVDKIDDDFLKALDFLKELEEEELKEDAKPTQEFEPDEDVLLTLDDLNLADRDSLLKIRKHIKKQWILPPGLRDADKLAAVVEIRLKEDGSLSGVKLVESSGQAFFDNSLLRAVRKAEPLPIPAAKYELFKAIELHFTGE